MSIYSDSTLEAPTSEETRVSGRSLAKSLYDQNLIILLTGELGAGKTTFAQGFAEGLGLTDRVQSPTYALENQYERLTHIDLYRLSSEQAKQFLDHSSDVHGIKLIEWAERIDRTVIGPHIHVHIDDRRDKRIIHCDFLDHPVPDEHEIDAWIRDVRLPAHIERHIRQVTAVSDRLVAQLQKRFPTLLRRQALHAAARSHDLLRFVDFKTYHPDGDFNPSDDDVRRWTELKIRYGTPHEEAAKTFLTEHGYSVIGDIVSTHSGIDLTGTKTPITTEQKLLTYADKRVLFDQIVSLDERYADFIKRYGKGEENEQHRKWLSMMKNIEREFFPDGSPDVTS
ncbi:tRNA (adenosine(37)-N6)-threonylcarbamoyltransferase complex ATPase subunit type 1 TsaE [Candidatus Peribacteria bacterium]|nr:tRNA (adenosine(37)-N6)-threonylcarbamoyltransferase complex ATPase subunit type 1 TsaE [Candidatus Peribacteria bacterium]